MYKIIEFETVEAFNLWADDAISHGIEIVSVKYGADAPNGGVCVLYRNNKSRNMYDGFDESFIRNVMNPVLDKAEHRRASIENVKNYRRRYGDTLVDLAIKSKEPVPQFCLESILCQTKIAIDEEYAWNGGF